MTSAVSRDLNYEVSLIVCCINKTIEVINQMFGDKVEYRFHVGNNPIYTNHCFKHLEGFDQASKVCVVLEVAKQLSNKYRTQVTGGVVHDWNEPVQSIVLDVIPHNSPGYEKAVAEAKNCQKYHPPFYSLTQIRYQGGMEWVSSCF